MKDIPPAGRGRDKLIDDLKGYHGIKYEHTDWSTSRNDVWELWNEIKCYVKTITEYANGMTWVHCFKDEKESMNQDGFIWCNGKNIADAVSRAWLEWKEIK